MESLYFIKTFQLCYDVGLIKRAISLWSRRNVPRFGDATTTSISGSASFECICSRFDMSSFEFSPSEVIDGELGDDQRGSPLLLHSSTKDDTIEIKACLRKIVSPSLSFPVTLPFSPAPSIPIEANGSDTNRCNRDFIKDFNFCWDEGDPPDTIS
mmetsp:Transcript_15271/g.26082  ORF Transcript_15271/g.26082 Transcript_15271/m.26082 type:complete len:155 (-) Transcript_15271:567-1031(-)